MNKRNLGRLAILALLLGIAATWHMLGLGQYATFESLNANKARLLGHVAEQPVLSAVLFILVYMGIVAFSIPVATALTVLSGVLFGRWFGTLWVNLAATAGATLSCLAARYLLRDWVLARFPGERLAALDRGIARDGLSYLLFLRLLPVFPFFLVNLGVGLTAIPLRTFAIGTMIGTLPGTFLYVNAGHALTDIGKPTDIFSPGILGSFVLLGLFSLVPVVYKRWKQRQEAGAAE